ncbi:MAG: aspartyl protease family protein [Candidatus Eremiobacteraeota bacterium]|nr:aspartyl protease family protein [Candidatus Eremiobacteraeota bacterium]
MPISATQTHESKGCTILNRFFGLVAFTATIVLAGSPVNASTDKRGAAIVARVRAALGGPAYDRLKSLHLHGAAESLGISGTEDFYVVPSRRAFLEIDNIGPLSGRTGYTGSVAWSSDQYGIVREERFPEQRRHIVNEAYRVNNLLLTAAQWPASIRFAGKRMLNGSAVDVLNISPVGGSPFEFWISDTNALPVRIVQPLSTGAATTDLKDYRPFGAVRVPTLLHISANGNTADFHVSNVTFNDSMPPEIRSRPHSTAHDFGINGARTATIPFELVENHVYVKAFLDGKGPYTFIFDTGGVNIITPEVADALRAAQLGSGKVGGIGATREQIHLTKVKQVDLGSAHLIDQDFLVLDIAHSFGVSTGMHVDGLIGSEVLSRFITTFDYANRQITFALRGSQTTQLSNPIDFAFNGDTPQIRATLDGIPGWFTVDTGARGSLSLDAPFVRSHPSIVPPASAPTGTLGFGVGGGAIGRLGRVRELEIGGFTIANPVAAFTMTSQGAFAASDIVGNIGGAIWKRFAVTFDYPDQRIGLRPNADFTARDTYDRSGLFLIQNNGAVVVYDVLSDTPAAALGIKRGDIITAIDEKPRSLQDAREMFRAAAGTRLTLSVKAASGAARNVDLVLTDYV